MQIPYGRQWISEEDIEAVGRVLCSAYLTTGPVSREFEKRVADHVGARYAVAVSSGTAALHVACLAAGIGVGDEVITTPITFAASANCVLYCGGTPVFADIDEHTYNIDPAEIEKQITPQTKAVIPVHYAGQPCDMDAIRAIAKKHRLTVIEDGAHALGSVYRGKRIGTGSDMICFSFHPVKPVTTGEGGMVVTDDERLYQRLLLFRNNGVTRSHAMMRQYSENCGGPSSGECQEFQEDLSSLSSGGRQTFQEEDLNDPGGWYYQQLELGYNYRLTDIASALGCSQMDKLDRFLEARRAIAARYDEAFRDIPEILCPQQMEGCESGWHLYTIQCLGRDRRAVFDQLRAAGLGVNVHYIPVYRHPYYQKNGYAGVYCPKAEEFYSRAITLPIFPALTQEQQEYVIRNVIAACRQPKI